MFELKRIAPEAIPHALERIERYRLLNEPLVAESICLDVLETEPGHQQAQEMLLLALTDQFAISAAPGLERRALDLAAGLTVEYDRLYYTGIVYERQAKARLHRGYPGAGFDAYDLLHQAMEYFEQAHALEPLDNADAILRWNSCARIIMDNNLKERPDEDLAPGSE
jgi:hypothetical protein